eukprot:scaffold8036_cov128-Isochrysis_galbana.AAC.8
MLVLLVIASLSLLSSSLDGKSVCMDWSCLLAALAYSVADETRPPTMLVRPSTASGWLDCRLRSAAYLKSSSENPFFTSGCRRCAPPPPDDMSAAETPEYLLRVVRAFSRSALSCSSELSSSINWRAFSRMLMPWSLPSASTNSNFCSFLISRKWSRASSITRSEPWRRM